MDRGRKRIFPCTKTAVITAGRGRTRMCPFCLKHFSVGVPSVYSIIIYIYIYKGFIYLFIYIYKDKAVPGQALRVPEG